MGYSLRATSLGRLVNTTGMQSARVGSCRKPTTMFLSGHAAAAQPSFTAMTAWRVTKASARLQPSRTASNACLHAAWEERTASGSQASCSTSALPAVCANSVAPLRRRGLRRSVACKSASMVPLPSGASFMNAHAPIPHGGSRQRNGCGMCVACSGVHNSTWCVPPCSQLAGDCSSCTSPLGRCRVPPHTHPPRPALGGKA